MRSVETTGKTVEEAIEKALEELGAKREEVEVEILQHPRWGGFYRLYAFPVLNLSSQLERIVYYEKDETEARKLEQR
ncbi:MAG: Jag N-terminal domain-containing protein, partial [bacterium]